MLTKYCTSCGQQVKDGSKFCPSCGFSLDCEQRSSINSVETSIQKASENSLNRMNRIVNWLWASFWASIISSMLGWMDVKHYYDVGLVVTVSTDSIGHLLTAWLFWCVSKNYAWARRSCIVWYLFILLPLYILCTLLSFVVSAARPFEDFIDYLDLFSIISAVICCCLMLRTDIKMRCVKVSRVQSVAWWFLTILWLIAFLVTPIISSFVYEGTEKWARECLDAACKGSRQARLDLIDAIAEEEEQENNNLTKEECHEKAIEFVDDSIMEKKQSLQDKQSIERKMKFKVKGVGKRIAYGVFIGICAIVSALVSKVRSFFKKQTTKGGSK